MVIGNHPQGIVQGIGAWRAERKAREKPRFPASLYEDCTESWLAVRAKALYNSYVFLPCMII